MCPLISIIIPARNDAAALQHTLQQLQQLTGIGGVEILVAASGDRRSTEQAVAGRARLLWPAGSSRSALMNSAADIARGEILFFSMPTLFLHAMPWCKSNRCYEIRKFSAARLSTAFSKPAGACARSVGLIAGAIG